MITFFNTSPKHLSLIVLLITCLSIKQTGADTKQAPIKALLVTGGCFHDYVFQAKMLTLASSTHADIDWTVVNQGGEKKDAEIELYNNPDWAKPYDVVVHNECFADTKNVAYIKKITAAHKNGTPAAVIHCSMHSYRDAKTEEWQEFLGVTSYTHDHESNYPVKVLKPEHPIMKDVPKNWVTPLDELYLITKIAAKTIPLATSTSKKDGSVHPVIWTNSFHGTRVFGTTYGHSNQMFSDPIFLKLLTNGILWSANRL